jgi:hypothetical protein
METNMRAWLGNSFIGGRTDAAFPLMFQPECGGTPPHLVGQGGGQGLPEVFCGGRAYADRRAAAASR